jgi:hypothetical protein
VEGGGRGWRAAREDRVCEVSVAPSRFASLTDLPRVAGEVFSFDSLSRQVLRSLLPSRNARGIFATTEERAKRESNKPSPRVYFRRLADTSAPSIPPARKGLRGKDALLEPGEGDSAFFRSVSQVPPHIVATPPRNRTPRK